MLLKPRLFADSIPSALTISFQRLTKAKFRPTDFVSLGFGLIPLAFMGWLSLWRSCRTLCRVPKRATNQESRFEQRVLVEVIQCSTSEWRVLQVDWRISLMRRLGRAI